MSGRKYTLTKEDRELLQSMGYSRNDVIQINYVVTRVEIRRVDGNTPQAISSEDAKALLGQKLFLSGLGRSSFHYTATRTTPEGISVQLDATHVFK